MPENFSLLKWISKFRRDERGVFAIMVAVATPLLLLAPAALIVSVLMYDRQVNQYALDNALLAKAATPVNAYKGSDTAQTLVNAIFAGDGGGAGCTNSSSTPTITPNGTTSVTGTYSCTESIGGGTSIGSYTYTTTIQLQLSHIEVSMVFDNTGSMAENLGTSITKITSLKDAAMNFLQVLQGSATTANAVRVSISPFTTDVKITDISIANRSNPDPTINYINPTTSAYEDLISSPTSCKDTENWTLQTLSGGSYYQSTGYNHSYSTCRTYTDNYYYNGQYYRINGSPPWYQYPSLGITALNAQTTWLGCVIDRNDASHSADSVNYQASSTGPTGNLNALMPADNVNCGDYTSGPMPVIGMTDLYNNGSATIPTSLTNLLYCRGGSDGNSNNGCNYSSSQSYSTCAAAATPCTPPPDPCLSQSVACKGMLANGNTDLSIAFDFGWSMLIPNYWSIPLNSYQLSTSNTSTASIPVKKFLVIFTDGINTQGRFYPPTVTSACGGARSGSTWPCGMDTATAAVCDAIHNDTTNNITVYTVGTSDADSDLLTYCASSSSDAFVNLTPTQMTAAFTSIAGAISNIRISQ